MRRRRPINRAVGRPRHVLGALLRWARTDVEVGHRPRPLPVGSAQAVGPGITAPDDDHVPALSSDWGDRDVAFLHPVGPGQILHRRMDALELAAWYRQLPL